MTPEQHAIKLFMDRPEPRSHACCCMGPQPDEPKCPCEMQYVVLHDGLYYEIAKERTECGYNYTAKRISARSDNWTAPDEQREFTLKERLIANRNNRKSVPTGFLNFEAGITNPSKQRESYIEKPIGSMTEIGRRR